MIQMMIEFLTRLVGINSRDNGRILPPEHQAVAATYNSSINLLNEALHHLQDAEILTQENFDVVANHPGQISDTLICLQKAGILTPENRNVAANLYRCDFHYALCCLQETDILTQDKFDVVATNANPYHLACALHHLQKAKILTPENRDIAAVHPNISKLERGLFHLQDALTQDSFDAIANHTNPGQLGCVLLNFTRQGFFNYIVKGNSIILETNNDVYLRYKKQFPSSQNMFIPREYYDVREQYLNQLVAYLLQDTLKPLPINVIAHILEFVQEDTSYRLEAMDIIQHVQLPQNLDLDVYKHDLNQKVQEFTTFQDLLNGGLDKLNLREQGLLISLEKSSFWANRHSCADAQHAFDNQYGLVLT